MLIFRQVKASGGLATGKPIVQSRKEGSAEAANQMVKSLDLVGSITKLKVPT